jgi:MFS family permease
VSAVAAVAVVRRPESASAFHGGAEVPWSDVSKMRSTEPESVEAGAGAAAAPPSPPSPSPLLAPAAGGLDGRSFHLFWGGQTVSSVGDAFAFVAMPLLVLEISGSIAKMGVVTAIASAGQIIAGLFSGTVVDRLDRRRLMIACDVARALFYLAPAIAAAAGHLGLPLIYVVTALGSLVGSVFMVANVAAIPDLVDAGELRQANSRLQASQALAYVIGPILAGVAAAHLGPTAALTVDAVSFGVSAASLAAARFRRQGGHEQRPARGLTDLAVGVRFLLQHRFLRASLAILLGIALLSSAGLSAAVIDLVIFRLRHDLGETGRVVGICLGVAAIGALAGALLAPRIQGRLGFGACLFGGTALQAAGLLLAGAMRATAAVGAGAALWATGLTVRSVAQQSVRQALTPAALMGRTMAASWTVVFAGATVGAIASTRLAARIGASGALRVLGVGLILLLAVGAFTPAAAAHPERD